MLRIALSLAFALLLVPYGEPGAFVICTNPDGETYATDDPPPGCRVEDGQENRAGPVPEASAGEEPAGEPETPESRKRHAITICEQTVAEQLDNSGAVNWPSREQYKVLERGRGDFTVEGFIETQSPLGNVRKSWTCRAVAGGDRWAAAATFGAESAQTESNPAKVEKRTSSSWHETTTAGRELPAGPAQDVPPSPATGRVPGNAGSCPSARFQDTFAERYANQSYQIVKGTIANSGSRPIRNVRVCAANICTQIRSETSVMEPGAAEPFSVRVPSLDTATVTADCAVVAD